MSQYDRAINELLAGKTLQLPETINITSFRRQYNRTLSALRAQGVGLGYKRLSIDKDMGTNKYTAKIVHTSTIAYEVVEPKHDPD